MPRLLQRRGAVNGSGNVGSLRGTWESLPALPANQIDTADITSGCVPLDYYAILNGRPVRVLFRLGCLLPLSGDTGNVYALSGGRGHVKENLLYMPGLGEDAEEVLYVGSCLSMTRRLRQHNSGVNFEVRNVPPGIPPEVVKLRYGLGGAYVTSDPSLQPWHVVVCVRGFTSVHTDEGRNMRQRRLLEGEVHRRVHRVGLPPGTSLRKETVLQIVIEATAAVLNGGNPLFNDIEVLFVRYVLISVVVDLHGRVIPGHTTRVEKVVPVWKDLR
uniref:GIY-YIG domain-containing protein n=1 Tax=Chromera velia CCMP2878 TaxID=1169474 RepID=A0A0G4IE45_9ALVE|eukprot:Cvel_13478.t1-p1 / transcript=Cvel_13478.t1 / gene=Cvel_13478 / organism=Chromera_velia_CCMP2878 / gene_product=hypothetical protein / transcript_product=hypothetical protein / location=Cvel_scaffold922:31148-31960(+) / protein_length=271 / sequence_SO=supercontig / SO=protein_coding / is_pseudo=false